MLRTRTSILEREMFMKKIIALFLLASLVLTAFAGCDKKENPTLEEAIEVNIRYATLTFTVEDAEKLFPAEFYEAWGTTPEEYHAARTEVRAEYDINPKADMEERIEAKVGANPEFTFEITDKTPLSQEDLDWHKEQIIQRGGVPNFDSTLSEGYTVEITITVKGSQDQIVIETEDDFLKIENGWYFMMGSLSDDVRDAFD